MPSELDEYFDVPKPKKPATVAVPTACPWAPEHLRPLMDWLMKTTKIRCATKSDKAYQIKCASGFYEEFGSDVTLADKAYRVLRKSRYIVSSLDSLRKTARGLKIVQIDPDSEDERRKYLGWDE